MSGENQTDAAILQPLWPGRAAESGMTFFAAGENRTGSTMVVCPGGAYTHLAHHEGEPVARWLNSLGIDAYVLKYRLGPTHRHPAMLEDVQRAIRLARHKAPDPNRVGVLGFSAGGHLAACACTLFTEANPAAHDPPERLSSRPDLAVLLYPVIALSGPAAHEGSAKSLLGDNPPAELVERLSVQTQVTRQTPPTFMFHTVDDPGVPVVNSFLYASALRAAGVPFELHCFEHGRHGVGLATDDPTLSLWTLLCARWLANRGF